MQRCSGFSGPDPYGCLDGVRQPWRMVPRFYGHVAPYPLRGPLYRRVEVGLVKASFQAKEDTPVFDWREPTHEKLALDFVDSRGLEFRVRRHFCFLA